MSDGDACSVQCGYCGRCSSGADSVERTCKQCGETFDQPTSEPYLIHVLCDLCIVQRDLAEQRREDFFGAGSTGSHR